MSTWPQTKYERIWIKSLKVDIPRNHKKKKKNICCYENDQTHLANPSLTTKSISVLRILQYTENRSANSLPYWMNIQCKPLSNFLLISAPAKPINMTSEILWSVHETTNILLLLTKCRFIPLPMFINLISSTKKVNLNFFATVINCWSMLRNAALLDTRRNPINLLRSNFQSQKPSGIRTLHRN